MPPDYAFANQLTRALNHTKVKLTWDETDPQRVRKFQKIMEKDGDDDDYREFLASQTESEEEEMDKDRIEEYRQKLLGGLTSSKIEGKDLQGDQELDIKFNVGFGEDLGKKVIKEKKERDQKEVESAWE